MGPRLLGALVLAALRTAGGTERTDGPCVPFERVFPDAPSIATTMWVGSDGVPAFEYVDKADPQYEDAYVAWWTPGLRRNPNDFVTLARLSSGTYDMPIADTSTCHLGVHGYQVESPRPVGDLGACQPWAANSCCSIDTVRSADRIKELYNGVNGAWDSCGDLPPACEFYFVQEACLYECDVNAGLFRRFHPARGNCVVDEFNIFNGHPECAYEGGVWQGRLWEIAHMPIKGEFFDGMWRSCRGTKYCTATDKSECRRFASSAPSSAPSAGPTTNGTSGDANAADREQPEGNDPGGGADQCHDTSTALVTAGAVVLGALAATAFALAGATFYSGRDYLAVLPVALALADFASDGLYIADLGYAGAWPFFYAALGSVGITMAANLGLSVWALLYLNRSPDFRTWAEHDGVDRVVGVTVFAGVFTLEAFRVLSAQLWGGHACLSAPLTLRQKRIVSALSLTNNVFEDLPQLIIAVLANTLNQSAACRWSATAVTSVVISSLSLLYTFSCRTSVLVFLFTEARLNTTPPKPRSPPNPPSSKPRKSPKSDHVKGGPATRTDGSDSGPQSQPLQQQVQDQGRATACTDGTNGSALPQLPPRPAQAAGADDDVQAQDQVVVV